MESLLPYLSKYSILEHVLVGHKIIWQSLPWGRVGKEEKGKKIPAATLCLSPRCQSPKTGVPAGSVLQAPLLGLQRGLLRSVVGIYKRRRRLDGSSLPPARLSARREAPANFAGCTRATRAVAFRAEPRHELLTGSSFFCIQLYFLLGFSSRGSRMVFRLSMKGVESTSMSMWVLAASKLSSVGRTGKLSGPAGRDRGEKIKATEVHPATAAPQGEADAPFLGRGSSQSLPDAPDPCLRPPVVPSHSATGSSHHASPQEVTGR